MMLLSFKGGIHPPHRKKYTEHLAVKRANEPKLLYIPLQQHIGAPCKAIVSVGDIVKLGQKIGEEQGFVSSPVHSSVSGTVKEIKEYPIPGGSGLCIVIENDLKNELHESVTPKPPIENLTSKEIIDCIKEAGIVGMGGATFPTHVKLSPPPDKKIDTIILNGAECEPYLTADHRLMLETPQDIIYGLKALMKALNVPKGYIGVEDNKPDAFEVMSKEAKNEPSIEIVSLRTKYPQGAEKQLIYACTKREVPSGGLPMDAGVVVNNVGTAAQIGKSLKTGLPLVERITTVTGSPVVNPQNLLIKVGTPFKDIIEECGGFKEEVGKLIMGGPMMGITQTNTNIPVTKGTSGILALNMKDSKAEKCANCIRCGKCVQICPAFLQPLYVSAHSLKDDFDKCEEYRALDCIECGSCSFVCPSKRPLLQSIRVAKREIIAKRRRESK